MTKCPAPWCRADLGGPYEIRHPEHEAMSNDRVFVYEAFCVSCGEKVTAPGHPCGTTLNVIRSPIAGR